MIKPKLIIAGFLLVFCQYFLLPISIHFQYVFFLTGIVILGVPHGAADLLIATQNAKENKKTFSKFRFFVNYLFRLVLFAIVLWLFPLMGNLIFIFFAAYHFGETDLYRFNTTSFTGKLFVLSYGLVVLGVILLHHFDEIKPIFLLFDAGIKYAGFINFIGTYRYSLMTVLGLFFFINTFIYFFNNNTDKEVQDHFLVHFILILIILYNLPMVLGFTFYFVVWHSFLSLNNIVAYLRKDGLCSAVTIIKQISLYSILAMVGTMLFGFTGFMFINMNALMGYVFLGLAVLTAPHMQVMNDMYNNIRNYKKLQV